MAIPITRTRFRSIYRLLQIGIALIPTVIGVLALLNDAGTFKAGVQTVAQPLISMAGDKGYMWRALPPSFAPYLYSIMFISEFMVGVLALIGVLGMIRNFCKPTYNFEHSKHWVYIACLWGTLVWGLGFFEGGGDWFLAWMSNNASISGLQQGSLMYVTELFFVFFYLKYTRETDVELDK